MKFPYSFERKLDIFWSKVNKRGPYPHKKACEEYLEIAGTRCWEWIGELDKDGYGISNFSRIKAHRIAFSNGNLAIIKNICILHKCDNKKCIRPLHTFKGTRKVNMQDKCNKQRQARGENHRQSTVLDKDVCKIRTMYTTGLYTHRQLGYIFNLSHINIGRIIRFEIRKYA